MSNVIHNRVRFILMVIVAIVAHDSLPSSTVNAHYNGYTDSKKQRRTATQIQMQPVAPAEQLHTVDASANLNSLFEQLNRNQFGNSIGENTSYRDRVRADAGRQQLRSYNANTKLLHWLSKNSPKQDLLVSSALAARHKDDQDIRLQRIESDSADRAFERLIKMNLKQERTDESLTDKKVETKNLHAPFFNFCKTTSKPTSVGRKEQSTCPVPKPIKTCQKKGKRKLQRMLKLAKTMKRRACLIIKKLNLLESEIHKRWPGAKSTGHKNRIQSGKPTAPQSPPPPPAQSQNEPPPGGKQHERLDRPTPGPATQSPFKHNRGFYFGLSPPDEENNEENLAAALREEQKLEQKVLEEHQMQRERDDKIKRARYEAAPPAAARIEYFITTPASKRNNWHHVNNTITKRNKENLNSNIPVDKSISLKRLKSQLQRVLRQHKRARHRIKLHQ